MSAALLLLALQLRHAPEAGPRAAIAGIAGFQSVSRIDFGAQQNRLTAVYVFPDRARWHFESYGAVQRSEHQYIYRSGERVRAFDATAPSEELQDAARTAVLLQLELRRAAMLWPDGFAWETRSAELRAAPVRADSCCAGGPSIGTLLATLEDGRPKRIEVRNAADQPREALVIHEWQERDGRKWPRRLTLETAGGGSFEETIEALETHVHFLEISFVPPDVRPVPPSGPEAAPRPQDLVATTYRARELPADVDWPAATVQARAWIEEAGSELRRLGLDVDPVPTFELGSDGRPRRCLVRLAAPLRPPPPAYETHDERPGLLCALESLSAIDAALLARLARTVPAGARAGTPYLRLHEGADLSVEVVIPLDPLD